MKAKIRVVFLLTVLFLLVILSGCVAPESPATTPKQTEMPTSTPTELSLKIGETAKLSEIEVIVISVNKTNSYDVFNLSYSEKAGAGKVFIAVDMAIKNMGNKGISSVGSPFEMVDSAGFEHYEYWYKSYKERLSVDNLYPNQTRRGKILFEIPKEAEGLRIKLNVDSLRTPDNERLPTKVKSVSWVLE